MECRPGCAGCRAGVDAVAEGDVVVPKLNIGIRLRSVWPKDDFTDVIKRVQDG